MIVEKNPYKLTISNTRELLLSKILQPKEVREMINPPSRKELFTLSDEEIQKRIRPPRDENGHYIPQYAPELSDEEVQKLAHDTIRDAELLEKKLKELYG
jgi:hypothetical protein